jgi:hypothetical protein
MSRLPRGYLRSKGYEVLQNFAPADALGVDYDYTTPALTPPMEYAARFGWTQTGDGLWVPGTVDDADDNSTKGPIGGSICYPPGSGARTQPQWAMNPFLAQVQSVGPPLEVAVVQKSDGTLSGDLSEVFECTLLPGASAPSVGDYGFLIQPARLDAQDPLFVPQKGGGSSLIAFQVDSLVGAGIYNAHQIDPVLHTAIGGGIVTALLQEMNLSNDLGIMTNVYCQHEVSGGMD